MATTLSTQTIPRFIELPVELQIEVWKYAFAAEDPYGNRQDINNYYSSYIQRVKLAFESPRSAEKVFFNLRYTRVG